MSFSGYKVIGKDKTIYNVVAKDMPLSHTSNAIIQGTCVDKNYGRNTRKIPLVSTCGWLQMKNLYYVTIYMNMEY